MAVNNKITVFWNVIPCSLLGRWRVPTFFSNLLPLSEGGDSRFLQATGTCPDGTQDVHILSLMHTFIGCQVRLSSAALTIELKELKNKLKKILIN